MTLLVRPPRLILAVLLAASLAAPALAQTPISDPLDERSVRRLDRMEQVLRELRAIVFQGRETGQPITVQPADTGQTLQELRERLASLEQSLARLTGELERANFGVEESSRALGEARAENARLTARMNELEQKIALLSAPPPPPPPLATGGLGPAPASPVGGGDEAAAFAGARRLLQDGDFAGAERAFTAYLQAYGRGPRGLEANYYLGRTLMARRAYSPAAEAFVSAIAGWPDTQWAPDSVVEAARALVNLRQTADACQLLSELDRRYPRASGEVKSRAATLRLEARCR